RIGHRHGEGDVGECDPGIGDRDHTGVGAGLPKCGSVRLKHTSIITLLRSTRALALMSRGSSCRLLAVLRKGPTDTSRTVAPLSTFPGSVMSYSTRRIVTSRSW